MGDKRKLNNPHKQDKKQVGKAQTLNSVEEKMKVALPDDSYGPTEQSKQTDGTSKEFLNINNSNIKSEKKKSKGPICLHEIPPENLENFYKYQYYNMSLQQFKEEWDILAIFPDSKSVINIEVKLGPKEEGNKFNLLKEASRQTNNHFSYFQKVFGSKLTDDWNFIKAAFVPYLEVEEDATEPCKHCQIYILKEKEMLTQTDIFTWIERLTLNYAQNTSSTEYENLVASIIGHSSLKEFSEDGLIISPLDQSKKVEASITGKNLGIGGESECNHKYLLNTDQLNAVHNKSSFLIIDGDYGTGKTFVLKERVKSCAKEFKDEKIAYINLTGLLNCNEPYDKNKYAMPTVMDLIAMDDFSDFKNVTVISCHNLFEQASVLEKNLKTEDVLNHSLNDLLGRNGFRHIFIDEMVPYKQSLETWLFPNDFEVITISMKFNEYEVEEKKEWIKSTNATHVHLKFNMRNAENIVNASSLFGVPQSHHHYSLLPRKNIKGNINYFYINRNTHTSGTLAAAAIEKYFSSNSLENIVVLTSSDELKDIYQTICRCHPSRKILCSSEESDINSFKKFLNKSEGIFCTTIESFQGAQARNSIIVLDVSLNAFELRNYVLRALALEIVILSGVSYTIDPVLGLEEDKNLHDYAVFPTCFQYKNVYDLNFYSLTLGIKNKYLSNRIEESLVILIYDSYFLEIQTNNYLDVHNNITYNYFELYALKQDDKKKEFQRLLNTPCQVILINISLYIKIDLDNVVDVLSLPRNLVIFDHVHGKTTHHELRYLIPNKACVLLVVSNKHSVSIDYLDMKIVADINLHEHINAGNKHDCYHYQNKHNLDEPTITLGVLNKYIKDKTEGSLVILCPRSWAVFKQLEKKVFGVSCDFQCFYFHQDSLKNEETKGELNDLLFKPRQIIFIQIQYFGCSYTFLDCLSLAKNIVIFSSKNHWSHEGLKRYNSECRNLILNIRPKFAIVIHDGNIEEFIGPNDYPLLNMKEDTDLHNNIQFVPHDCVHYKNTYNLDEPIITSGVLDKHFKDKNEESFIILSLIDKTVYQQLEKKVSNVLNRIVCTYFHQNNLENEETKSELNSLLHKPRQIIFIQIQDLRFSYALSDLLSLAKNIVIFSNKKCWSDKILKRYNSECRNLILNIRPKFAIVIHDGNIEEFIGPNDYPLLNMKEDTDLHNNIQFVPHDCVHYKNIYNLDEPTITLGVLHKYYKDEYEEGLVILTTEDEAVFKQLEKKVSDLSSDFECFYFHQYNLKNEETKGELNDLLLNPRQIIFIQIKNLEFSYTFFDLLSLAKNIVIFSSKNHWSHEGHKKYISGCRNLILNIRPKFALVIHDGNIEEFTGTADYPLLNMIEDTDLHNNIQFVPHDCVHYKNIYKLDEPTITLGVLDKYFKDEYEESLVILTTKGKVVFKQLEKKVSDLSNAIVCSYFHQNSLENEDTKSELNYLLHKPRQIIFIQIQSLWFSYAFFELFSLAKNIVIFSNKKCWSDELLKKYNSECRNLILNIRPKFAIVIHDGNIEEFTGTADYPLLNMIEDADLHNNIQVVPHDCYHYQNIYKLDEPTATLGVLDKYFKNEYEEGLVILTTKDEAVSKQLDKKVSDVSNAIVCTYYHEDSLENEDTKSELNNLLCKPRQIIFIQIQSFGFSYAFFDLLLFAKNFVIFSNEKHLSHEGNKEYKSECRNLILNIRPKFALVIHDGNIKEFAGTADHPFLNMIEVTDLHNNIQIVPHDCFHYQNEYNLKKPTITLGVLDKYFKDKNEESLVIVSLASKAVFEQLERKVSDLSSDFVCSYFHQNILKNEDTKSELNDLLLKPRQIIYIQSQSFGFSYAFFDLLLLAKNIVIFSNKKNWPDNENLKEYNSECRNLILNIRPKFAIVIHDGNIEEFIGTADYPFLNMKEDTDLHNHVNK